MADAVNAVPNPSRLETRGIDAVHGQISSAHNKSQPKNKAIYDLLAKGTEFRARTSGGEAISEAELKPKAAIPLPDFPVDHPVTTTPPSTPGSRKSKRTIASEATEPSSSELSSPAVSELGEDPETTADENTEPGKSGDGQWVEAKGPLPSKKACRTHCPGC